MLTSTLYCLPSGSDGRGGQQVSGASDVAVKGTQQGICFTTVVILRFANIWSPRVAGRSDNARLDRIQT